eukprot:g3827.t1
MGLCYSIFSSLIGSRGTDRLLEIDEMDVNSVCIHAAQRGEMNLDLPSRKMEELPQSLSSCKSLTSLDLSGNKIRNWKYLPQLRQLQSLRARDNRLDDVPLEFYSCAKLTKLDVSENRLKTFPRIGWSGLKKLDLSNNKIEVMNESDLVLGRDLLVLELKCNRIRRLPPLGKLQMLEELSMSNNRLLTLQSPAGGGDANDSHEGDRGTEMKNRSSGTTVAASKTEDKEELAPFSWAVMTNLRILKASHNKIRFVPDDLGRVKTLQFLFLNGNALTCVPASLGDLLGLVELRLQENKISSLPEGLFRSHSAMSVLHLSSNMLRSLPRSIKYLTHLTELRVAHNELTSVPSELGCLKKLRRLDVGYNRLRALPDSIGKLSRLRELRASNNDITALPTTLTNCVELRVLLLSENAKLTDLVRNFASLAYLERLDASKCAIERVDPSLGLLGHLQVVRLENNRLSSIPDEIAGIGVSAELQVCNLTGNPLIHVPPAIVYMLRKSDRLSETSLPVAQSIVPGLLLGGMPAARNKAYLDALGVTHIINLAGSGGELNREGKKEIDANRIFPGHFRYLDIDVADSRTANLNPYFDRCIEFVDKAIDGGGRCPVSLLAWRIKKRRHLYRVPHREAELNVRQSLREGEKATELRKVQSELCPTATI